MSKQYHFLPPLTLRLIIGFGFMAHSWAKVSRGTGGFEKLLVFSGVPFAYMNSYLVPAVELLGGLAILLGIFVRIATVPMIIIMAVAMVTVQVHYGFSSVKTIALTPQGPSFGPPGYEINLLYIAGLISLMVTGAGNFSLDVLLPSKKKTRFNPL
jgi:putative oxidoreductase